jgi:hypothetical protein
VSWRTAPGNGTHLSKVSFSSSARLSSGNVSLLVWIASSYTMALPNNILVQILKSLYADFLKSDECQGMDIGKHHCSLLYPCVSISKSTTFKPIYTFRLISSNWNNVFLNTAKLDRYASHRIVRGPHKRHTFLYNLLQKSVVFRRYRVFRNLDTEHGIFLTVSLIFFSDFSFFLSTDYYQNIEVSLWHMILASLVDAKNPER